MEYENKYASKGVGNAGLTTGIIGTALGVLNGGLGGNAMYSGGCYHEGVNHYELSQEQRISDLQAQVALRDANIYQDNKMLEMYKYFDGKLAGIEQQLCQQNVINAQITANLGCMQKTIDVLQGLTKVVVPINNICPQPMAQYNSWVAPTEPAEVTPATGA